MSMAKRNSDIRASRKHTLGLIAIVLFALVASVCTNDAKAATKPDYNTLQAFHLTEEDQQLYHADFGWCLPTPTDGFQCYVLGSDMAGVLGAGDPDAKTNREVYGDVKQPLVSVNSLPPKAASDATDTFKAVWGN